MFCIVFYLTVSMIHSCNFLCKIEANTDTLVVLVEKYHNKGLGCWIIDCIAIRFQIRTSVKP